MNTRSFLISALIAGVVIGILANFPLLNLINCFLCVFVWVGGILAVFLYGRLEHGQSALTPGQGAGIGALAGLFGAFVGIVVNALTNVISIPLFNTVARFFQIEGDLPFRTGGLSSIVSATFFFFLLDAVAYPIFGALSGWIAASLSKKQPQA
jgi:hypothetical protein